MTQTYDQDAAHGQTFAVTPYGRSDVASATFTPSASYSAGTLVGGLITVETGRPLQRLELRNIGLIVPMSSITTAGSGGAVWAFDEAPSGTWTDAAAPSTADWEANAGIVDVATLSFVWGLASGKIAAYASQTTAWPIDKTADAEGKLYFAIILNAVVWDTPGEACFKVRYRY